MKGLLSLNQNLIRDASSTFTLEDIITAKPEEFAECNSEPRVKIPQARRSIEIDQDVVNALRKQFGNMPLGRAIRILVGLKPKIFQNAYQEEEDKLIREYYPSAGGKGLAEFLGRSADCVRDRAYTLGVKRQWLYKRDRRNRKRPIKLRHPSP